MPSGLCIIVQHQRSGTDPEQLSSVSISIPLDPKSSDAKISARVKTDTNICFVLLYLLSPLGGPFLGIGSVSGDLSSSSAGSLIFV
jgi:hypothetical protein